MRFRRALLLRGSPSPLRGGPRVAASQGHSSLEHRSAGGRKMVAPKFARVAPERSPADYNVPGATLEPAAAFGGCGSCNYAEGPGPPARNRERLSSALILAAASRSSLFMPRRWIAERAEMPDA